MLFRSNDTATTEIYTLSLHDALPIYYELGKRRADAVSRYLVTQKKMDPLRVVTVSYGENSPVTDNNSRDGRAKNRRVEILVYREAINSNTAAAAAPQQQEQKSSQASDGKQMTRSY